MEEFNTRVYVDRRQSLLLLLINAPVELTESVEFKSLPSGLHNVHEDIIYFVHDEEYVGVSAFVNEPAEDSERNALMLAVGVLVPNTGRLGKSWKHAIGLKALAEKLSKDPTKTGLLEEFWTTNRLHDQSEPRELSPESASPSVAKAKRRQSHTPPKGRNHARKRAVTAASALAPPGQALSPHHPALSLPLFLDTFGPLIFPLYKAALLRERVLLMSPGIAVELACNFVYDVSILSGIPSSVSDFIPLEPFPARLQPLFAVGVHDMQTLAQGSRNQSQDSKLVDDGMGFGWVATTTDSILSLKEDQVYDVLVALPADYSKRARERVWPVLKTSKGTEIKATQRDLRRYHTLRRELCRLPSNRPHDASPYSGRYTLANDISIDNSQDPLDDGPSTLQLAEPQSWSALAYDTFIFWASSGEKRTDVEEEEEHDAALMQLPDRYDDDSSPSRPRSARKSPGRSPGMEAMGTQPAGLEVSIIAYFHRLTTIILKTLADIIDASDYSDGDSEANGNGNGHGNADTEQTPLTGKSNAGPEDQEAILVNSEDMSRMGLDIWSESDKEFVRELVAFYWGRKADVRGGRVECCGVRIC